MKLLILGLLMLLTAQVPIYENPQMQNRTPAEFIEGEFDIIEEELGDAPDANILSANLNVSYFEADPYGQKLIYFGAQWVISQLIGHKYISNNPTWNVSKVNSGELRVEMPWKYYTMRLYAEFMNDEGETVLSSMILSVYSYNVYWAVLAYDYILFTGSLESEDFTEQFLNGEEPTEPIEIFQTEDEAMGEETLSEVGIFVENWIEIPLKKARRDEHLLDLVVQGAEYAINKAFQEGTIPVSNWTFGSLESASFQILEGVYYYFIALFDLKPLEGNQTAQAEAGYFVFEDFNNSSSVISSGIKYLGQV